MQRGPEPARCHPVSLAPRLCLPTPSLMDETRRDQTRRRGPGFARCRYCSVHYTSTGDHTRPDRAPIGLYWLGILKSKGRVHQLVVRAGVFRPQPVTDSLAERTVRPGVFDDGAAFWARSHHVRKPGNDAAIVADATFGRMGTLTHSMPPCGTLSFSSKTVRKNADKDKWF